jgi:hypothetical protein
VLISANVTAKGRSPVENGTVAARSRSPTTASAEPMETNALPAVSTSAGRTVECASVPITKLKALLLPSTHESSVNKASTDQSLDFDTPMSQIEGMY